MLLIKYMNKSYSVCMFQTFNIGYDNYVQLIFMQIGYKPAGPTVQSPPPQNDRGWVHFFRMGCLVPPKKIPKKKWIL